MRRIVIFCSVVLVSFAYSCKKEAIPKNSDSDKDTNGTTVNPPDNNQTGTGNKTDTTTTVDPPNIGLNITEGSKLWSVTGNQGITNDGTYYYVTDSYTLTKRRMSDNAIVMTKPNPAGGHKVGGIFYVASEDVLFTVSGTYEPPFETHFYIIDKNTLEDIYHKELTPYTHYGVNAIAVFNNKIYIGETAAGTSDVTKQWYEFDLNANFIQSVFSDVSHGGENDYQNATVVGDKIYATDHVGYIHVFSVLKNGKFKRVAKVYTTNFYREGLTLISGNHFVVYRNTAPTGIYKVDIDETALAIP